MFEDFRKQIDDSAFSDDNQEEASPDAELFEEPRLILGLTPVQRFLAAFMLLLMITVVGVLALLVTSKIALPFVG